MPFLKFVAFYLFLVLFGSFFLYLIVTETTVMLLLAPVLIALLISPIIAFGGEKVTRNLAKRTDVASSEELQREDDVLLQAVAFSQSTLFVVINLLSIQNVDKLFPSVLIVTFAVSFYFLRAWGKVKQDSRFRFYSMLVFSFLIANTFIFLLIFLTYYLALNISVSLWSFAYLVAAIVVYANITEVLLRITYNVFGKRYGRISGTKHGRAR